MNWSDGGVKKIPFLYKDTITVPMTMMDTVQIGMVYKDSINMKMPMPPFAQKLKVFRILCSMYEDLRWDEIVISGSPLIFGVESVSSASERVVSNWCQIEV